MTTRRAGAISALIVVAARLLTSHGRREYAIWPDEPAQLAIARLVGGGTRWSMHNHSTWRPGFATLLAPIYWFTDDPVTVLRSALVVNALLGGVAAWLLVLLARRLTTMGPWMCAAAAVLISLSPAVIFTTDFVWSEALVAPLYLATLLVLLRFQDAPGLATGVGAGVLGAAAFGTHSRMLPLSFIVIGVVALAARRRRLGIRDAALIVVITFAAMAAVSLYSRWVVGRLWDEPSNRNSIGGAIGRLTDVGAIALSLAGQSWYLLVSSLAIIAYGVCSLLCSARRHDDARLVLVVAGACASLSVAFMADRWRPDQLVYGRYNDVAVAPLLLVGVAALVGAAPTWRLGRICAGAMGATVACAGALLLARRDLLAANNGLEPMILGLQPFIRSASSIPVARITTLAVVLMAVLLIAVLLMAVLPAGRAVGAGSVAIGAGSAAGRATGPTRAWLTLVLIGALVSVGYVRTRSIIDRDWHDWGNLGDVAQVRKGLLGDGTPVDFYLPAGSNSTAQMMAFQMYLPRNEFTIVSDPVDGRPSTFVFAPVGNDALRQAGARTVWIDDSGSEALWQR